ncbi:F-box/FBD/LRR-repeat protein At1g13570-like isoform X1 [Bidens hawaiensis]|uniref:F-box/FBD/LRR-repeat protein At1g13570-like isoform X1 n=1 Tax=Bidens hawaiensis TaxID=980011 RepID=UPI0040491017
MELIHGTTQKASKLAPEDFITDMPDIIITNILDRLPIQDAMRTSILARNWRSKWTLLSQLVFDRDFCDLLETRDEDNPFNVISRIILRLKGAIVKFDLTIDDLLDVEDMNNEDFNNLILLLSRKGVKDLTSDNEHDIELEFPTHLFSCLELKHLKLRHCCFNPPPTFHGFPNLLSLDLCVVAFEKKFELGEFFTRCPLLENLAMDDISDWEKIKLDGIAKLENLKILSLRFCDDYETSTSSGIIFQLLDSLPKLQELQLDFEECRLTKGGANKRFPTVFLSLKFLKLSRISLDNGVMFSCAYELLSTCPNLLYLEITTDNSNAELVFTPRVEYDIILPLRLRRVVFQCFNGSENELRFIEILLANSPVLDKIQICFRSVLTSDEKLMFTLELLKFHRISPVAEIKLF